MRIFLLVEPGRNLAPADFIKGVENIWLKNSFTPGTLIKSGEVDMLLIEQTQKVADVFHGEKTIHEDLATAAARVIKERDLLRKLVDKAMEARRGKDYFEMCDRLKEFKQMYDESGLTEGRKGNPDPTVPDEGSEAPAKVS